MVASSGRVATHVGWDLSFFLAQAKLASSGQVHHVRQREDARLHMEMGPRIHRRNQGHTTLPLNTKRRHRTHSSPRRLLEKLGSEKDKGRTRTGMDFLSEEATRTRPGNTKPPTGFELGVTGSLPATTSYEWDVLAYEVEPPIPIVLHAKRKLCRNPVDDRRYRRGVISQETEFSPCKQDSKAKAGRTG